MALLQTEKTPNLPEKVYLDAHALNLSSGSPKNDGAHLRAIQYNVKRRRMGKKRDIITWKSALEYPKTQAKNGRVFYAKFSLCVQDTHTHTHTHPVYLGSKVEILAKCVIV